MKKNVFLLLCMLLVCALFTGCNKNEQDIAVKPSDTQLVFDNHASQGDAKFLNSVYPFSNKTGFVSYSGKLPGDETYSNVYYFGTYNMDTKELIEAGKYNSWLYASEDGEIIMNDRYLYVWGSFRADEGTIGSQINLIRVDMLEKKTEVLDTINDNTSSIPNMSKLSENELISIIVRHRDVDIVEGVTAYTTQIVKHNSITGEAKTIIENKYSYTEGDTDSDGILLESVCAIDGKVYAVARQKVKGEWKYYFDTYDDQGILLSRIDAPALEHSMKNNPAFSLYVVGNYFTITTTSMGKQAMYRINGDQIEVFIEHEQKMLFPNMSNLYSSENTPYVYYGMNVYAYSEFYQEMKENIPVYALKIDTGEIKTIKIDEIDQERPHLNRLYVDEIGNLVIVLTENKLDFLSREYFISSEALLKLLK